MNIQEATQILNNLKVELAKVKSAYKRDIKEADEAIVTAQHNLSMLVAGLDVDRINRAKKVIAIKGSSCTSPQRCRAIREAINDISEHQGGPLKERYRGVKIYSGFGEQGEDCSYGMGPRHGSIVFSVGFTRAITKEVDLTEDQIEDALYYLHNLGKVFAEKEAA